MTAVEKMIKAAKAEIGYLEKSRAAYNADPEVIFERTKGAGYDNLTKYAYYVDHTPGWFAGKKQGYAWCSVFYDALGIITFGAAKWAAATNHSIYGAVVDYAADAYKDMGRLFFKNPRPGDQIFFGRDYDNLTHTGLVYKVTDSEIYTIEGNTNSMDYVVESNGGGVFMKRYSRWSNCVCCFGRPLYENLGDDEMTGEEIYKALTEYMNSRAIPEGMRAEYQQAIDMGITDGSRPMGLCTRIESTLITKRAIEKTK